MTTMYILSGTEPIPCDDVEEWAEWILTANRAVARSQIGRALVSTVFLGLDYQAGKGPPLLFETTVSRNDDWDDETLCSTWAEAEAQHEKVCRQLMDDHIRRYPENAL